MPETGSRREEARLVASSPSSRERLLTADEVAELLAVHVEWVYDRAKEGVLPSYKIGRRRLEQLRDALAAITLDLPER